MQVPSRPGPMLLTCFIFHCFPGPPHPPATQNAPVPCPTPSALKTACLWKYGFPYLECPWCFKLLTTTTFHPEKSSLIPLHVGQMTQSGFGPLIYKPLAPTLLVPLNLLYLLLVFLCRTFYFLRYYITGLWIVFLSSSVRLSAPQGQGPLLVLFAGVSQALRT